MGAGFEELKLAGERGLLGFGDEGGDLLLVHGTESFDRLESLIHDLLAVDAGDENRDGQIERVVQSLDGLDGVALQDDVVAEALHAERRRCLRGGGGERRAGRSCGSARP